MTVKEFCLKETQVSELCVIRDTGWIVAIVWIDAEDLFAMNETIAKMEVKSDEWGTLSIITKYGDELEVPCHYIDC